MAEIAGILLAAGGSSRFGEDKLLHPLRGGTPLAVAAARTLVAALPYSIAVVRPACPELARLLRACGLDVVVNSRAAEGMGTSLARGVAATADAAGWVVALGDMPWIATETIARVADALRGGASIVAPAYGGRRGHPVGFAARHRAELIALRGDRGARDVVVRHAAALVAVDDPGILQDVDERTDLERRGPARGVTARTVSG